MKMSKGALALIIGIAILVVDQAIKVAVKLNMKLDEAITVFSWFQIRFIENNGMAWGMELGSKLFKIIGCQVHIVCDTFFLFHFVNQLLEILLSDFHNNVGIHLDKSAVAVPRPTRIV